MSSILAESHILVSITVFLFATGVIGFFGIKMTYLARDLAGATGLGQAFMGAVLIGATTSLSGIIASASAAWVGNASLAVSNSLGGIAAQTLFLVLGDMVYRKANLEYAAASAENLMMAAQLTLLLMILLVGFTVPTLAIGHIHPVSFVLVVVYLFSIKWLADTHEKPMWLPRMTRGTVSENRRPVRKIISSEKLSMFSLFFFYAVLVGVAGWLIAMSGVELVNRTGLSASLMGGIFVAVATSLPELVVAITAIRMGALTLAVGDVIGGNTFDTLFIAVSDFLFREGSIFNFIATEERVWLVSAMLMNAVLMLGLMYRERKGFANIGLESLVILLVYLLTLTYLGFSVSY